MQLERVSIPRRKISEQVAERLARIIVAEDLQPGALLPSERELMEAFQVGRASIREALFALRKQGVVEIRNGERGRVAAPSAQVLVDDLAPTVWRLLAMPSGMSHFQDARSLFEVGVAERAAQLATEDDIARLRDCLEANRGALGDQPAFERTDVAFHFELARIARNPIFTALHAAITTWMTQQRSISGKRPRAGRLAIAAHTRIFEAVAGRRPTQAADAMRAHLAEVAKLYAEAIRNEKKPPG